MTSDTLKIKIEHRQKQRIRLDAKNCFSGVAAKLNLDESDFHILTVYDRSFSERISNIQSDYSFAWPLGSSNTSQRCGNYSDIADLITLVSAGITELGIRVDETEPVFLYCETKSYAVEIPAPVFLEHSHTVLEYLWELSSKDYNSCIYILPKSKRWFFLAGTEKSASFDLVVHPEGTDKK